MTERFNVRISGRPEGQPMVFAHGFGCDQHMWRYVSPRFENVFRVVLFDHIGAGGSNVSAYDPVRYASLEGYAEDVLTICRGLDRRDVIFVGRSVSAMIGVLAAIREPERFAKLVPVGPSARYIDDGSYIGGFGEAEINELLESLESNYLGWYDSSVVGTNSSGTNGMNQVPFSKSGYHPSFPSGAIPRASPSWRGRAQRRQP